MLKFDLRSLWLILREMFQKLKLSSFFESAGQGISGFFVSWWKLLVFGIAAVAFLYYPLGGWFVNKIDTTTDYEINTPNDQSATVEMMSFLIHREVTENMWTPNLPFMFPSYFLDNMPSFQLGMLSSLKTMSAAMSAKLDKMVATKDELPLKKAADFLKYPGTIWMFSPQNKLLPAPSAGSQYRKARKQLIAYNQALRDGSAVFYKSPQDLAFFIQRICNDLWRSNKSLEERIRENSSDFFDFSADEVFYFQKGKVYVYYLLLKTLAHDYKDIIVSYDVYQPLTNMLKSMESVVRLSPMIVRNGVPDSSFAPNSLLSAGYYTVKAASIGRTIVDKLSVFPEKQGK